MISRYAPQSSFLHEPSQRFAFEAIQAKSSDYNAFQKASGNRERRVETEAHSPMTQPLSGSGLRVVSAQAKSVFNSASRIVAVSGWVA